jgi:predicted acetyltransferase
MTPLSEWSLCWCKTDLRMQFTLVELREDDVDLIRNLARYYIHDLSQWTGWSCPADGLFVGIEDLDCYFGRRRKKADPRWSDVWSGTGFKVLADNEVAGFCLLRFFDDGRQRFSDMGEFFILRKFRGIGLGAFVARSIFHRYPGRWQVRVMQENKAGHMFWRRVLADCGAQDVTEAVEFFPAYNAMLAVQRFAVPASSCRHPRSEQRGR